MGRFAEIKSIAGCLTDKVPGIKGVATGYAIKYLNGDLTKGKKYDVITSDRGKETRELTRKLVTLPYKERPMKKLVLKKDVLSKDEFVEVFDRYKFITFLEDKTFQQWVSCFGLK